MRTIEVKLYSYDELSDEAKKIARKQFNNLEYHHYDEVKATMNAFAELFDATIVSWELGYGRGTHIHADIRNEDLMDLSGVRLFKWIYHNIDEKYWSEDAKNGSCPLTGVCFDCNVLDDLVDFMKHPTDDSMSELVNSCRENLRKACEDDVLYTCSDEYIEDHIEANGYEFTEEGNQY